MNDARNILACCAPPKGWQPIETAPKDGTPMLLWDPEVGTVGLGYWGNPGLSFGGKQMRDTWIVIITLGLATPRSHGLPPLISCKGSDATHWMMLPSGPKEAN